MGQAGVTINLPADFFLGEEYLPDVDKRVLAYRRLAAAVDLARSTPFRRSARGIRRAASGGANLFDRARIRIRAERLGCASVSLANGRLVYQGIEVPRQTALRLKERGGVVDPKTHKVAYPFHRTQEEVMPAALGVLEEIGGDDEAEDGEE